MKTPNPIRSLCGITLAALAATAAHAQTIANGGFEAGLTAWTTADQLGSDGTFFNQTGTTSPVNAFAVPAPPSGTRAAMTDSVAGGSHVLYQDFVVPAVVTPGTQVRFSLFLNNTAGTYSTPATLNWASTDINGSLNLNQQARVDLITTAADPFSLSGADVLLNLFQTTAATPPVLGYTPFAVDVTAVLQAHLGETVRLRFAEVDNVNFFNMGVDEVSIAVPAPASTAAFLTGLIPVLRRRRRRRAPGLR